MASFKERLKVLFGATAEEPQLKSELTLVDGIVQGPLNVLRTRESKIFKASMALLAANLLAVLLMGGFTLLAHHYKLDTAIAHLEIPANVYQVIDAGPAAGSNDNPFESVASAAGGVLHVIGNLLMGAMFLFGLLQLVFSGNVLPLVGALIFGLGTHFVLPVLIESGDSEFASSHVLRAAVKDDAFAKVRSLVSDAKISLQERQYVLAQLDLVAGAKGTESQKAVAEQVRGGKALTTPSGQWMYAIEVAADGRAESREATQYRSAILKANEVWSARASIMNNVVLPISLATIVFSTLSFYMRRRIERISNMLELLA
ncbi:TPA: hypothetical protein NID16_005263 [Pseudomonas aeruginosa]|nr:hypothetical protein [Pseudomonas aeruginosa]